MCDFSLESKNSCSKIGSKAVMQIRENRKEGEHAA
nr:MAG TPA: hypothetical protein [Bacteriophage sp.]